jgi:hypothetical protein
MQNMVIFAYLSLFSIIAFTLLGLIKGPTAVNAMLRLFSSLFKRMDEKKVNRKSSSKADQQ